MFLAFCIHLNGQFLTVSSQLRTPGGTHTPDSRSSASHIAWSIDYFPSFEKTKLLRREVRTRRVQGTTKPPHRAKKYGGLLPEAYGTRNLDAQSRANTFRNESKTTALTKSNPCSYVLSCLAPFNDLLWRSLCKKESPSLQN